MHDKRRWLPRWQRVELVELCLEQGLTRRQAAAWRRVSVSTVQYWIDRYRQAGAGERVSGAWSDDHPCTPHHQPALSSAEVHDRVCEKRARTGRGPRLIASELEMAHATVSRCLRRRGMSRRPPALKEEVRRFEWPCPGDLLQMDTKRLARFSRPGHKVTGIRDRTSAELRMNVGWEYCHSIIDDHTRLAYTEIHPDEKAPTVTAFCNEHSRLTPRTPSTPYACEPTMPGATCATAACANYSPHTRPNTAGSPHTPKRNGKVCVLAWGCRPIGRRGSPHLLV